MEAPTSNLSQHQLSEGTNLQILQAPTCRQRHRSPLAPPCHPIFLATTRRKLQLPEFKHQLESWGQQSSLAPPYLPYLLDFPKESNYNITNSILTYQTHSILIICSTSTLFLFSVQLLAHIFVLLLFDHSSLVSSLLFICSASLSSAAHSQIFSVSQFLLFFFALAEFSLPHLNSSPLTFTSTVFYRHDLLSFGFPNSSYSKQEWLQHNHDS